MNRKGTERKQLEPCVPVFKEMLFRFIVSADSEKPFFANGRRTHKQVLCFHSLGRKILTPQILLCTESDAIRVRPGSFGMHNESEKQFFSVCWSDQIISIEKNEYTG